MTVSLCITEILESICEMTDGDTLAVMARSSKILHEPAIRQIWHAIPNLIPLLKCFPEDSWTCKGNTFNFTRVLTRIDWTAFLKYASWVRIYEGPTSAKQETVNIRTAWQMMCSLRPTLIFFPQLRVIRWSASDMPDVHLSSFLTCVGTQVVDVELFNVAPLMRRQDELQGTLGTIFERFATLRNLTLTLGMPRRPNVIVRAPVGREIGISPLIYPMRSLESFRALDIPVSMGLMLHLASLPALERLDVGLPDASTVWTCKDSPTGAHTLPLFPQLRYTTLSSTLPTFLEFSMTLPRTLRSLDMHFPSGLPRDLIPALFVSIRNQFDPSFLVQICIFSCASEDDTMRDHGSTLLTIPLGPLLDFKQLVTLIIDITCVYTLDDVLCDTIARAWPHIESLYINLVTESPVDHINLPSVRALSSFAMHCPVLKGLGLNFNGARWSTLEEFNADQAQEAVYGPLACRASSSTLVTLSICYSPGPITRPEYMAAFLARIFPTLERILECDDESWQSVQSLLVLFKGVRQDERLRMAREAAHDL
ncbi:hypothetical protein C2E23DRAFT_732244 [Lenzites betulinus]|nr:hypothetical protein C2E23DRAFT_732244 [Lenzites betulinus]